MISKEAVPIFGTQIKKGDNFVETVIDQEVVLLNTDNGKFYSLDSVGSIVWKLLDDFIKFESVISELLKKFDVEEDDCVADVSSLLRAMEANRFVVITKGTVRTKAANGED